MVRRIRAEVALATTTVELGECPGWDEGRRRLLWVDILGSALHVFDPETGVDRTVDVGQHIGAVTPHVDGGFAVAVQRGFGRLSEDGELKMVADIVAPGLRMNDGKCAPDGSFWAGTMAYDRTPGAAALYRLAPDGTVTTLLEGLTISNGLCWDPGGTTMYFVDTPTRRIDRLDVDIDASRLYNRRPFVELPAGAGNPDGMTIDDDGYIWVAMARSGTVHRYQPNGRLDAIVDVPVPQVTSCCFGGSDGRELFITTGRQGAGPGRGALAGSVFRCRPGASGRPAVSCVGP